jgi:MFS family permease
LTAAVLALQRRTFRSLRQHRNYRLFFVGQAVSVSGSWMQNTALAWLVIELTHSPVAVGALAFCRFVPFTALGLVAGVVTDRVELRRLVIVTQAAQMGVSAALAVLALTGTATLPLVYALALLGGVALVFDAPGRQALTFQLVGPEELPNAVALNSSLFNASRVLGPAIGGVVIAALGVGACFAVNTVSFLAVLAALLAMDRSRLHPVERDTGRSLVGSIRDGLRHVAGSRETALVLAVVTTLSLVGFNFHVIVPLLAEDTLHVGAGTFGLLSAAFGLGALVGALAAATLGRASWKAFMGGTLGFSAVMLALAPLDAVAPAAALLFLAGLFFAILTASASTIVQLRSPDSLRGRVLGLYLFAFAGLTPVGGLLAGWLVALGGTALSFAVAGLTGFLVAAVAILYRRAGDPGRAASAPIEGRPAAGRGRYGDRPLEEAR